MAPETKAAFISTAGTLVVALISSGTAIYITMREVQDAQPTPHIVRVKEPYPVTMRETIREYVPINVSGTPIGEPITDRRVVPSLRDLAVDETMVRDTPARDYQAPPNEALDMLLNKKIGIYYALGDISAKSRAGALTAEMRSRGLDAAFYSIGRWFSTPPTPEQTHIYGIPAAADTASFEDSFRNTFNYVGPIAELEEPLTEQPTIEDTQWNIAVKGREEKDIYIVIGS